MSPVAATPSVLTTPQWNLAWNLWQQQQKSGQVDPNAALAELNSLIGNGLDATFQPLLAQAKLQLQQNLTNIQTQIANLP